MLRVKASSIHAIHKHNVQHARGHSLPSQHLTGEPASTAQQAPAPGNVLAQQHAIHTGSPSQRCRCCTGSSAAGSHCPAPSPHRLQHDPPAPSHSCSPHLSTPCVPPPHTTTLLSASGCCRYLQGAAQRPCTPTPCSVPSNSRPYLDGGAHKAWQGTAGDLLPPARGCPDPSCHAHHPSVYLLSTTAQDSTRSCRASTNAMQAAASQRQQQHTALVASALCTTCVPPPVHCTIGCSSTPRSQAPQPQASSLTPASQATHPACHSFTTGTWRPR